MSGEHGRNILALAILFGHYVFASCSRVDSRALWLGSFASLLAPLGYKEEAVRLILSRACKNGEFVRIKRGRKTFYRPSPEMLYQIQRVAYQVYQHQAEDWDRQWRIVTYQIPEDRRKLRERFRARLAVLGFGHLTQALWISPYDLSRDLETILKELDLVGQVLWCETGGFNLSPRETADRSWHLTETAVSYEKLAAELKLILDKLSDPMDDAEAFGRILLAETRYLQVAKNDPGLPPALLPQDWPANKARELFDLLYERLCPQAYRYFNQVAIYDSFRS